MSHGALGVAFMESVAERVQPFLPAIVPLFERQGRRVPDLLGCSVALRGDNGALFLLTANHVLEAFERKEIFAWTPVGAVLLRGHVACSETEPSRFSADDDDAAVFEVTADGNHVEWIREHALGPSQLDPPGIVCRPDEFFALVGCPSNRLELVDGGIVPAAHMWVGFTETDSFDRVQLPRERHVAFEWDQAHTFGFPINDVDRTIIRGRGPSHRGVSGSPMIILANRAGPTVVAAILTDYRDGHLIGTSTGVHLEYIADLLSGGEPRAPRV